MNKGIWKFLTILGFFLAILVVGMMLVLRFQVFERLGFYSAGDRVPDTQQMSLLQTQALTQQLGFDDLDVDKKNLERLHQGCLSGNDCIPSIDQPKFVSARQAVKFLKSDDLVIGAAFEGWETEDDPVKAYPIKIMNWHEVVNDFLNENPVVVTYCPLCMTPRVFGRLLEGKFVDFGVSGMLLNSNLVVYDRDTKSLWSQFDGQALAGPKRGEKLTLYPSEIMRWGDWVKRYPSTVVLSTDTGYDFDYNQSPYSDYAKKADVYFPLEHRDARREPKEIVFGIVVGNQTKAYPELEIKKALPDGGTLSDEFAGKKLTIAYDKVTFNVAEEVTKEKVPHTVSYYFTWVAFYPNTQIFLSPDKPETSL